MVERTEQSQPAPLSSEDYLWHFLASKKTPLDHQVLRKDRDIFRKIGVFEKDLPGFLAQPQVAQIGETMMHLESEIARIESEYSESIRAVNGQLVSLEVQKSRIRADIGQLRRKIEGVGRNRFIQPGDFALVFGRLQVRLWEMQQFGKMTNIARAATLFIKPTSVHPALAQPEATLAEVESQKERVQDEKKAQDNDYLANKIGVGNNLAVQQEQLFENLDDFAATSLDRLIVYSLYYRRLSAIEHFALKNRLVGQDRRELLQSLTRYGVVPNDYSRFLTTLDLEVSPQEISDFRRVPDSDKPLKMMIGGEVYQDVEAARAAFFGLERGLSNKTRRLMFGRLEHICRALSEGQIPNTFTRIVAGDLIKRMGGEWHTGIGRHRIIMNLCKAETGEPMIEVVKILKHAHDNPEYY